MSKISITHEFDSIEDKEEMNILMNASETYVTLWHDIDNGILGDKTSSFYQMRKAVKDKFPK